MAWQKPRRAPRTRRRIAVTAAAAVAFVVIVTAGVVEATSPAGASFGSDARAATAGMTSPTGSTTPTETLTPEGSPELAALLSGSPDDADAAARFAAAHRGSAIVFEGVVGAVDLQSGFASRSDVLLRAGDGLVDTAGPKFQLRDIHLIGDPERNRLTVSQRLRVTGIVVTYERSTGIVVLTLVSYEPRA